MAWFILFIAGIFEIAWAVSMRYSEGFAKPIPSVITVICMCLSFMFLSHSMKFIPLGTAYAIWVGIGSVGVACVSIFYLGEPSTIYKFISILLVVLGIVGLKLFSG